MRKLNFADRIPLRDALAWIDAHVGTLGPELIDVAGAAGRTAVAPLVCQTDVPFADCAAVDGYAMRSADSEGAGDYNPISLSWVDAPDVAVLPPGSACAALAGMPLPMGADAVLPIDAAQRAGPGSLEILMPVARGAGVDRRGSELRGGSEVIASPSRLRPQDVALLAGMGAAHVAVVRQPRVRLVVPGPKVAGHQDALTPMLRALVARDGGTAEAFPLAGAGRTGLAQAVAQAARGADLVFVAGRSGAGMDDDAPLAIAEAGGRLDLHGIALRPGDSTALGRVGSTLTLLLPGAPLACLASYDMLAARVVRRMAGLPKALPYPVIDAALDRKVVSAIGLTDLVRVRVAGTRAAPRAEPLGSVEGGGLVSAVRADGFVIVPEASEGYAAGSVVRVHLYDERCAEAGT